MKMKILEAGLTETKLGGKLACFNSGETGIKVDESQPSGSQSYDLTTLYRKSVELSLLDAT